MKREEVSEVFRMFKDVVTLVTAEVVRLRVQRKGNVWWTDEKKEAIEGKRRAYKKTLQRSVAEEIRVKR